MELKIGANIARYRKQKGMTQEQLARAVGVSPPAVSKWETGSSYPDVTLLSPIARTLGITADTLLSFGEELTEEDVGALNTELQALFASKGFAAGQARCEELLHEYPNCIPLKLTVGSLYQSMLGSLPGDELTEERLREIYRLSARLYGEVRASADPRYFAAGTVGLVAFRMSEGKLDEAEQLLDSLPRTEIDPDELYPSLYLAQGKMEEAERMQETRLFQLLRSAGMSLHSLASISYKKGDADRALSLCGLELQLARLFEEDPSTALQYSAFLLLELGQKEQAIDRLEQYAKSLLSLRTDYSGHPVFSHVKLHVSPEKAASSLRLCVKALEMDPDLEPLRGEPRFQRILEKLSAQADALPSQQQSPTDRDAGRSST